MHGRVILTRSDTRTLSPWAFAALGRSWEGRSGPGMPLPSLKLSDPQTLSGPSAESLRSVHPKSP